MKKEYIYPAVALIVVILAGVALYALSGKTTAPGSVKTGSQELHGQVECLPHKGSGPQTLECAYGIKGSDGKHYGVTGSRQITGYHMGDDVVVTGTVTAAKADETYDIVGNVAAMSIRRGN